MNGSGTASSLITYTTYDTLGRLIGKVMPNGNQSATIASDGTISGYGNYSSSNYGTAYSYYSDTATQTTPNPIDSRCPASTSASQLGLPQSITAHGLTAVTTYYDAAGRPVRITNAKGTTYDCYDAEGRLLASSAPGDSAATIYRYDPAGRQTSVTHPGGSDDTFGTVTTNYDEAGRVVSTTDANGASATFTYDADGDRLTRVAKPAAGTPLTFSGNELSDTTRADALQGDGSAAPDSSTGVWQATTNLLPNGGFEADNSSWTTAVGFWNKAATSLTRTTGSAEFGSGYAVVSTPGLVANEGVHSANVSITAGSPYTFSVWLKGSGTVKIGVGDATVGSSSSGSITLTTNWTRYSLTLTPSASGSSAFASIFWTGTTAGSFSFDGAQVEQSAIATPYVETRGSAIRPLGRVQIPTSVMPGLTQGWVALRVRMGFASSAGGSVNDGLQTGFAVLNGSGTSSIIHLYYTSGAWHLFRTPGGFPAIPISFTAGQAMTVIASWTPTTVNLSVDGSTFLVTTSSAGSSTIAALADIARRDGTTGSSAEPLNGDVLWMAGGTGTLSNTDATTINNYGNADPTLTGFPGTPTFLWDGTSAAATTPASGTSYTTNYSYNDADQLTGEVDPRGGTYSYSFKYDSRSNLQSTVYPNGTYSLNEINPDGWLTAVCSEQGTLPSSPPTNGTCPTTVTSKIAEYTYGYNQDGTKSQEVLTGPASLTTAYSYDSAGRLKSYTVGPTTTTYCYDPDSNRLQVTTSSCGTSTYTYNTGNSNSPGVDELTSVGTTNYQYAGDGQLQCRWVGAGTCPVGSDTFRWDGSGTLYGSTVGGKSVCYRFGADGSLASRVYDSTGTTTCATATATTNYLLGDLFETNAAGTVSASYQDGPEGAVASFNGAPTVSATPTYLYYNGHGDLSAEAGSGGTRTAAHSYDPFGAPLDSPPANATSHRYTARWDKQDDTTTGLILMGARPYDPTLGRFLTVDPIDGGSANNYDYAGQDPINGYDLDGTVQQSLAQEDASPDPCLRQICGTDSDPNWAAASPGTIASRLASAIPAKALLRVAGRYSGACLKGMALGSYGGPEGSTLGCLIEVGVNVAEHSHNQDIHKLGRLAAIGSEGIDVLTMRRILMNPQEAQALIRNWSTLLRQVTRR